MQETQFEECLERADAIRANAEIGCLRDDSK